MIEGIKSMGKRKSAVVAILGILLAALALWLLFSNSIIEFALRNTLPKEIRADKWESSGGYAAASIEEISSNGGFLQKVHVRGWTFVETEEDNSDREISLILENSERCYDIPLAFEKLSRDFVLAAYPELKFFSADVGFYGEFPAYTIQDGAYDFRVYCRENKSSYGLADTNKQLVKNGTEIYLRAWQSLRTEVNDPLKDSSAKCALDYIIPEDGIALIGGWAYQPGLDCAEQSVYLSINGAAYTTQSNARTDVAEVFKNESYTLSGYRALIPMEDIPEGKSEIRLLVENGGKLYSSASITVVRNGDNIQKKA